MEYRSLRENIDDFISTIVFTPDGRYRGYCPSCGASDKSFTATRRDGVIVFNCYHNSCSLHGKREQKLTLTDVKAFWDNKAPVPDDFEIPDYFVPALSNEQARKYLYRHNCMAAVEAGKTEVFYDPKLDRVVFTIKKDNCTVDAAGRALGDVKPKWHRYGSSTTPFVCHTDYNVLCIVEDAASACAVSEVCSGMALGGTSLQLDYICAIVPYKKLIVALDNDASLKALKFVKKLSFYRPTQFLHLKYDLKYMNKNEILELIGAVCPS
jgi:hypothetical protein